MHELQRDNTATFTFLEGDIDSDPGPGIAGYYDGPYYSYYRFPRTFALEDNDDSDILEAYEQLNETMAFGRSVRWNSRLLPWRDLGRWFHHPPRENVSRATRLVQMCYLHQFPAPFRMDPGKRPIVEEGLEGYISIPSVHIAGAQDPLFDYSLALHRICTAHHATFAVHGKGHDVPSDQKDVVIIATAIRKLKLFSQIW
ncbi:unnamed protein product [Penicillium salamii]|uniref:Serine hydrolase domain-containing protein n=1 Tax=Penicillium salamii TaxID=1612424 RepID=A0A9W4JT58_9EURO|nr:unnamed protein product [Penicillium salamii]